MEVKDVAIGPQTAVSKTKRISPKVRRATEEYLAGKDLNIEQLSEEQKRCVFRFIKSRTAMKCALVIGIISGVLLLALSTRMFGLFRRLAETFAPDNAYMILDDGTKQYFELDEEQKDYLVSYGQMCALLGGSLAAGLYSAAGVIVHAIGSVVEHRRNAKIFDAFLPAVRGSVAVQ
jgi:hypothetical protein